jgi:hypothetical protein
MDFDVLEAEGLGSGAALETMRGRGQLYEPAVVQALAEVCG